MVNGRFRRSLLPLLLAWLTAAGFAAGSDRNGGAGAAPPEQARAELASLERRIKTVVAKAAPAVVRVEWGHGEQTALSSGVIVTAEGHLVTLPCDDAGKDRSVVVVLADGRRAGGTALGWCAVWNVGLVKLDGRGPWPHVELGQTADKRLADLGIVLGYPFHPQPGNVSPFDPVPAARLGCISSLATPGWLTTSAALGVAELGGGLFDLDGRLIGVQGGQWRGQSVHAAVEVVRKYWGEMAAGKTIGLGRSRPGDLPPGGRALGGAAGKSSPPSAQAIEAAKRKAARATVWYRPGCSGVIVSRDGFIATCAHQELPPGRELTVFLPDGRTPKAVMLGSNPLCDLGLAKIVENDDWPWVELGNSAALAPGDACILLGFPAGARIQQGRPWGRVAKLVEPPSDLAGIQVRSKLFSPGPLYPGDSGGGAFDATGRLVGIHQGGQPARHLDWHVRADLFRLQWDFLVAGRPSEIEPFVGLRPVSKAFRRVLGTTERSVAEVLVDQQRVALGTVGPRKGLVLTKASRICGAPACRFSGGHTVPARVRNVSREHDLAVLEVDGGELPEAVGAMVPPAPAALVAALAVETPPAVGTVMLGPHVVPPAPTALRVEMFQDAPEGVELANDEPLQHASQPLVRGDVILHVNGRRVPNCRVLADLLGRGERGLPAIIPGEWIRIGVRRANASIELRFPLPAANGESERTSGFPQVFDVALAPPAGLLGGPVVDSGGHVLGVAIAAPVRGRLYVVPLPLAWAAAK
jgi:S1-C subfamily serine protease